MSHAGLRGSKRSRNLPLSPIQMRKPPSSTKIISVSIRNSFAGLSMAAYKDSDTFDSYGLQHDKIARPVARVARDLGNLIGNVLPLHDFAENRVPVVEPWRGCDGNAELTP